MNALAAFRSLLRTDLKVGRVVPPAGYTARLTIFTSGAIDRKSVV